ncbi:SpoIIE family protein phosphatase [Streptomyces thermolilacinus]|uniref:Protein phosphatase n=1 Tax=Streptomyces thermolilacinus SPC6 TaxID=1306406 RepID=A0A1D3E1G3_9ACTN|nr:SpoIIE family protein phosphatase [Streptomyces thermolilacinus]OEJ98411.1 protein phosphatase [Streptomyces thermolilacinus SPC6]
MDTPLRTFTESPEDPFSVHRAATAVLDARGTVVGWSALAENLLGYRPEDVIGRRALEVLIAPEDREAAVEAVMVCTGAGGWFGVLPVRRADGRTLWMGFRSRLVVRARREDEWFLVGAPADEVIQWETDRSLLDGIFRRCPIGVAVHGPDLDILRVNRAIAQFADAPADALRGARMDEFLVAADARTAERALRGVVETGRPLIFTEQQARLRTDPPGRERIVAVSAFRMQDPAGAVLGVTQIVEDVTDRERARRRLALLNDASERIGTTLDVTRTAEELARVAVPGLADCVAVDLLEPVVLGGEPSPDASGRLYRAALSCVTQEPPPSARRPDGEVVFPPDPPQARCLRERRPVLETDMAAARGRGAGAGPGPGAGGTPETDGPMEEAGGTPEADAHSLMVVPLGARGAVLGVVSLWRAYRPEPFEEDDLTLAAEFASRAAVSIDNARRYTQQRTAALSLQRSLLPADVPDHPAVEVAHRYLPAGGATEVGGDWFDVIPLSGSRVALVVGDVVGHGVPAAATMGRLRTAVHTLAGLDLEPDEVLSQLDDLVGRIAGEQQATGPVTGEQIVGASCLYAVYDPISRRCSLARAGHPPPVVVRPDGRPVLAELPEGPPLGLGGLPFESTEFELPEGSLVALYTDGLVESGRHDVDEGLGLLYEVLSGQERDLDALCAEVTRRVMPEHPTDDVAVLLARTRVLADDRVATWELPAEPTAAQRARRLTADQLAEWGLDDLVFTTELIVSELVTNAYRYASGPVQLRLIRDSSLICEVSDGSTTAPHLRRARSTDEGGRGLFLVAQLTERWGTRYSRDGKTVWTEQPLDGPLLGLRMPVGGGAG